MLSILKNINCLLNVERIPLYWMHTKILRCLPFSEQFLEKRICWSLFYYRHESYHANQRYICSLWRSFCPFVRFSVSFKQYSQCSIAASVEVTIMATQIDSLCGKKKKKASNGWWTIKYLGSHVISLEPQVDLVRPLLIDKYDWGLCYIFFSSNEYIRQKHK